MFWRSLPNDDVKFSYLKKYLWFTAVLIDFLDDIINSHVGGRKMPAICKLSFFRILIFQQTSATICKAHDFFYSIKINARDKRRHKCFFKSSLCLPWLIPQGKKNFVARKRSTLGLHSSEASLLSSVGNCTVNLTYRSNLLFICSVNRWLLADYIGGNCVLLFAPFYMF